MFTMAVIVIAASKEAIFIYDVASIQRDDLFTHSREDLEAHSTNEALTAKEAKS